MAERRIAPGYQVPLLDSPPAKRNGTIDHTGCPHDATPAGRKLCRANARKEITMVTTCPWCPDPDVPDARYHADGNPSHVPPVITADKKAVHTGDRVFDYYDGNWGTIGRIGADGWFDHIREDGQGRGYLDGSRVCVRIPQDNPFFKSHGAGNPS